MASFDLVAIEQGIKDAVKALNRPYIAEIATYGGEFDEGLAESVKRFPAVWVTFSGANPRPSSTSKRKWHVDLTFVVLVGSRSIRNEETTRHGAFTVGGQFVEVGTFQLLKDVQIALLGKDLSLQIKPLEMGRITTLFNTRLQNQAVSVLAQEYKTSLLVGVDDEDGDGENAAPILLNIGMDYHYPPEQEPAFVSEVVSLEE
ncbi:DUF1834 family protein [Agitococcus lubricus]|uniref:Phage gp37-like protein n=1 Tax=Agitococcus lubricus TaxID=1077255 RepID=A0A2T5J3T4_9GAMM|nr:phage protein Gp37 [Agitococcus lubricus]PTQ91270.1 phage gp37-like protein [Agitococcus lubricus]